MAAWLEERLPQIPRLNLNPTNTRVRHVLNWGGFVNHSFSIEDGSVRYHLKLTNDLDTEKFRRWHKLHHLLEQRYRAPEVIDWLEFPEIEFAGLLQKHIDGRTANFRDNRTLLTQLIALLHRLHDDVDLQIQLNTSQSQKTYFDHFVETYIDRFNADLEAISKEELPFVSPRLLKCMREEIDRLCIAAVSEQAFHKSAMEPVHADLHENNVLVTTDSWFVLDWDDLALGDPAIDFAVLVWPIVFESGDWKDLPLAGTDIEIRKRLNVCFRAQLLDEVIDPLADYVAAGVVPSKQAEVQLVKRQQHERALKRYRAAP